MNKNILWGVVVLIIVIVGGVFYSNKNSEAKNENKPIIKIGAILPLTGNLAFLGEPYKQSMLMALEKAKINGDLKYDYTILFEDDKFTPANGVTAANKLMSVDSVDVITSFGSPVGNAVSPITEKNKIIHLNGIASDPNVANGDYNFVHWTPPYEEANTMITELQNKKIKKVVLFEQNNPGVLAFVKEFKDRIPNTDIKIVADEKFNTGDTDFRTLISKVKNEKADIYMLEATSPELEILAKQIRDLGISTPFTSVESFDFTDRPQLFDGNWYVSAAEMPQWFIDEFNKKYNSQPKLGSGNGYDIVSLIINAFEETGDGINKSKVEDVLKNLSNTKDFTGVMGNLSVDNSGVIVTKAVLKQIKDGKAVPVE